MKQILSFLLAAVVFLAACGPSTRVTKSWSDPTSTVKLGDLNKILVVALVKDETSRRMIEDAMVRKFSPRAVASYSLPPINAQQGAENAITEGLKSQGFDGAIVTRLINVDKETSYVPGTTSFPPYYGGFGPYYWNSYGMYSTPGYYVEDKIFNVETNVYGFNPDKLLYSAVTQTTNPNKLDKTLTEIGEVIGDKMRADGFIRK
jgi:hypothetical protein